MPRSPLLALARPRPVLLLAAVAAFSLHATVALAATYMLRMVARAFFGPINPRWAHLRDLLPVEWVAGILLIATLVIVGVYPSPFLDMINASAAPVIERVGGHQAALRIACEQEEFGLDANIEGPAAFGQAR